MPAVWMEAIVGRDHCTLIAGNATVYFSRTRETLEDAKPVRIDVTPIVHFDVAEPADLREAIETRSRDRK